MDNDMMTGYLAGKSDGGGIGGMWGEWLPLLLIAGLLFGGGNGFGFGGGNRDYATQADVRAAVDQQTLISKIDQQTYGMADSFTALSNTLNSNFRGIDNAVCTLGFQTQSGFANLGAQLAQCCCDIRSAIKDGTTQGIMNTNAIQQQISACCCDIEKMNLQNRFDAQNNTNNTLLAIDKLGDRILGYMSAQETQKLRDEVQAYRLSASQAAQNQYLINELRPCPRPAYITCNPYAASLGFGGNPCGRDCGYGYAA